MVSFFCFYLINFVPNHQQILSSICTRNSKQQFVIMIACWRTACPRPLINIALEDTTCLGHANPPDPILHSTQQPQPLLMALQRASIPARLNKTTAGQVLNRRTHTHHNRRFSHSTRRTIDARPCLALSNISTLNSNSRGKTAGGPPHHLASCNSMPLNKITRPAKLPLPR